MGMILKNLIHSYIQSTTVLCDMQIQQVHKSMAEHNLAHEILFLTERYILLSVKAENNARNVKILFKQQKQTL